MPEKRLQGVNVLVPRPRPQGEAIAELIESHGGTAIRFPIIEIVAPEDFSELDHQIKNLSEVDLIVLVSVAAAIGLISRMKKLKITFPDNIKVATVGPKTSEQCRSLGINVDFVPDQRVDSEGLLSSLDDFAIVDKQVAIFRGQSGREFLKTELEKLGASVKYIECYRRRRTDLPITPVVKIWKEGGVNVVLITSVSILENLVGLLGDENVFLLRKTHVVTISFRIYDQCKNFGIKNVLVSNSPSESSIVQTLDLFSDGGKPS